MPFQRVLELGRGFLDSCARDRSLMDAMRFLLVHETVPAFRILSIVTLIALVAALPAMARHARRLPFGATVLALVLLNGALALRLWWMPGMPQVYFDEMNFLNTAETMARHGLHGLTSFDGRAPGDSFHPCPGAWQFLVGEVYALLGVHVELAFLLAACLSALTVGLLFVAGWEMFGSAPVALLGALFLAVLPIHVRLAGSAALETSSLFFLVAALASLSAWIRGGERTLLLLGACSLGWFVNVRMENPVVLLPLLGAIVLALAPSQRVRGGANILALLVSGIIVCLSMAPSLLADFYGLVNHTFVYYQSVEQTRLQVRSNMTGNLAYWVSDRFHPLPLTVLAALGVAWCRREHRRAAGCWLAWVVLGVAFYTMNPSCDFSLRFTVDSWRNALHPSLGLVMLAALGADALVRAHASVRWRRGVAGAIIVTALAVPWLFQGFLLDRHAWMHSWTALAAMRPAVRPGGWVLVADREMRYGPNASSIAYEMACTTGGLPRFFLLPQDYVTRPGQPLPQVVADVDLWTRQQSRDVLLYHVQAGTEADRHLLSVMRSLLDLEPVAGLGLRRSHLTFGLWRIRGAAAPLPAVDAGVPQGSPASPGGSARAPGAGFSGAPLPGVDAGVAPGAPPSPGASAGAPGAAAIPVTSPAPRGADPPTSE